MLNTMRSVIPMVIISLLFWTSIGIGLLELKDSMF
jgi:hypothetical protein